MYLKVLYCTMGYLAEGTEVRAAEAAQRITTQYAGNKQPLVQVQQEASWDQEEDGVALETP